MFSLHLLCPAAGGDRQQLVPEADAEDGLDPVQAGGEQGADVAHSRLAHLKQ